ncbi:MAG: TlpA disulfide reductase family protein, partial [Paracoccaceae bacterium]
MNRAKPLLFAVLYVALAFGANPAASEPPDRDALLALRQGEMRKLKILRTPAPMPHVGLLDMEGNDRVLSEFAGKYVVLNFWATWCAPCRKEMPSLNALQKDMGSDRFEVVLVAANRNPVPAIRMFFKEENIDALDTLRDPTSALTSLV